MSVQEDKVGTGEYLNILAPQKQDHHYQLEKSVDEEMKNLKAREIHNPDALTIMLEASQV